jgi:hypothetical protein
MFCPQCKAEYRSGFMRCTDCGVALEVVAVRPKIESAPIAASQAEPSAVLWRGQDPVSFSVILSALDEEGIFYKEFQRRDYAAALSRPFALGFYGLPHWEVRVCASDLNAARFIAEAALRPVSALAVETNWESESENSGREVGKSPAAPAQMRAPVKIWSGEAIELAQQLLDALIEQGIRCWTISSFPIGEDLLVCEGDEERARVILRGVLDRMAAA